MKSCPYCGTLLEDNAQICSNCNAPLEMSQFTYQNPNNSAYNYQNPYSQPSNFGMPSNQYQQINNSQQQYINGQQITNGYQVPNNGYYQPNENISTDTQTPKTIDKQNGSNNILYVLKASLQPTTTFTDTGFTIKNKYYPYSEIVNINVPFSATALTNGVIQITMKGGKILNCSFDKKHKEDGEAVIEFLKQYISQKASGNVFNGTGNLTTAENLYRFCIDYGYGHGFNESWGIKHFQILIDALMPNEKVLFPFIGLHNYVSMTSHGGYYAYAVTNKRIIMGQKNVIGQSFKSINWENINDITFKSGMALGVVTIDTYKEIFNVAIDKNSAQNVCNRIHKVLEDMKYHNGNQNLSGTKAMTNATDPYEELKKMKELLDLGIITKEEFDYKKKELLGL